MKSMTGHGRGEVSAKGCRVVVECFSVNRKQAEVSFAAGRDCAWLEPYVREEVLKYVSRGKVQVSAAVERATTGGQIVDAARAASFLREARKLQKKLGLSGDITLESVLSAPGVMASDMEIGRETLPIVKKALAAALDAMLRMRVREGLHLQKELTRRLNRLAALARNVGVLAPRVPERQRENMMKRLTNAQLPVDLADQRLAMEVALFADRCDVAEELARLESHYAQFRENLAADGPVGRTLEFLVQEMGREWNTTGSKANDAEISRLVVQAKAELDKLREQLANIE